MWENMVNMTQKIGNLKRFRIYKKEQVEILDLKNTVTEVKSSLDGSVKDLKRQEKQSVYLKKDQ